MQVKESIFLLLSEFNQKYQLRLGDTIVYRDDSLKSVKSLKGKVKQYVVSNGTIIAQTKKLRLSGIGEWMDYLSFGRARSRKTEYQIFRAGL